MLKYIAFILFFAQAAMAADSQTSAWLGTFAKKEITENYYGWMETQLRYGLDAGSTNQILYRTGLLHKINESHEVGLLYGYIESGNLKEHRFALQHVQKYGRWQDLSFSHRARFEARFLEDSDDDAARFRYLIRSEGETKSSPTLVVWDEVFLNTTMDDWTGQRTFDRNRLFLGFKMKVFKIKAELGYMNQYVPRESGDVSEHIITTYWFF